MCSQLSLTLSLLALLLLRSGAPVVAQSPADLLRKFKSGLVINATALADWDASVALCDWTGVTCVRDKFYGLQLEGMGLSGSIDMDVLAQLGVRSLSVTNNSFSGPFPPVGRDTSLRALFLSNNQFFGAIPDDSFAGMRYLKKVYLDGNGFSGKLPKSMTRLSKLIELDVEGNQFEGKIPEFSQRDWRKLDFAGNRFSGRIPASLSKVDQTSFSGNEGLCGAPLGPCKSSKKPIKTIAIVVAIGGVIAIISAILYVRAHKAKAQMAHTKRDIGPPAKIYERFSLCDKAQSHESEPKKKGKNGTLHFLRNDRFELDDLLRASAEVLGSGSFGSSYKATLFSGPPLVVKRFSHMNNVSRDEFQGHMARLGKLSHPNLLPVVAYYYTKEDKLLVSHFVDNGSLASHLHGKRGGELDWPKRLKIIKGVSKALSYLHAELRPALALPHGHLKSSNVLLDADHNPVLVEYGLARLLSRDHARRFMAAHRSPECTAQRGPAGEKSDAWSLGILILEVLTGRFPANYLAAGAGDLAGWVGSVVREEWTGEVFDREMGGVRGAQGQMLALLKVAMCCCEPTVERRWDCRRAAERIDGISERDGGAEVEDYSSYVTDWDVYSPMLLSQDNFSRPTVNKLR